MASIGRSLTRRDVLILLICSAMLISCGGPVMGVVPAPRYPARTMPVSFHTADQVLAKMRPACYFCSSSARYLDECLVIRESSRAAAKLMRLSDLAAHLEPAGIPASWHATPSTQVWVAAVSGVIVVPADGRKQRAVFALPHDAGFAPQVAATGPAAVYGVASGWPPYYNGLPDLSKS
jgi:hypothetical protein